MKLFPRFLLEGEGGDGGSNGGGGASGGSTLLAARLAAVRALDKATHPRPVLAQAATLATAAVRAHGISVPRWTTRATSGPAGMPTCPMTSKRRRLLFAKYPNPLELMRGHVNASKLIGQKTALKGSGSRRQARRSRQVQCANPRGARRPGQGGGIQADEAGQSAARPVMDEAKVGDWQKFFHDANIPPAVADKIVAKQAAEIASQAEAGKGKLDQWVKSQEAELRKEWGADFDANLGLAAKAASIAGFDLNDSELGNNAKFVQAMLTVSRLISPTSSSAATRLQRSWMEPHKPRTFAATRTTPGTRHSWAKRATHANARLLPSWRGCKASKCSSTCIRPGPKKPRLFLCSRLVQTIVISLHFRPFPVRSDSHCTASCHVAHSWLSMATLRRL